MEKEGKDRYEERVKGGWKSGVAEIWKGLNRKSTVERHDFEFTPGYKWKPVEIPKEPEPRYVYLRYTWEDWKNGK